MDRTTELLSVYTRSLTYNHLPPEVVHQTKRILIDTLGCALGGFHSPPSHIAKKWAQGLKCRKSSRIWGMQSTSSPEMTAFANGCMARYLDYNDAYASPSGGHPSDMLSAILAMSDAMDCDGQTTITAIVLAYEIFCRLSDQIPIGDLGWDHGTLSVIGAVCGVGKILGLNHQTLGHAISLAMVSNLPLGVTRTGELSMWKGCAAANSSRTAIVMAQLAELGLTGPNAPFEGTHGLMEKTLGKTVTITPFSHNTEGFRIMSNIFKLYPCQTHTQGPISLALELRPQIQIPDIASIHIRTYGKAVSSAATELEKWEPKNRETADHSIPYLVATAFHHGKITPKSFSEEALTDSGTISLIKKIHVDEDFAFTQRFAKEYNCHMKVTANSGEILSTSLVYPKGFPGHTLSDIEIENKFRSLARQVLPKEQCAQALGLLWSFEHAPNLTALLETIVIEQ